MKTIKTISQLKRLASDKMIDCAILLAGGLIRSSKSISYNPRKKVFDIFNEIDGSFSQFTEKELSNPDSSNIGKALKLGALIQY